MSGKRTGPNPGRTVVSRPDRIGRGTTVHPPKRGNYGPPARMTDRAVTDADYRDCDLCGARVPAAVYHEHLLKECPGRRE